VTGFELVFVDLEIATQNFDRLRSIVEDFFVAIYVFKKEFVQPKKNLNREFLI
jgi:hypothetical protein